MWPLEFTATPATSPKFIPGGSLKKSGTESKGIGGILKLLQSGNIRSYATWVVIGSVALILVMGVVEGVGR